MKLEDIMTGIGARYTEDCNYTYHNSNGNIDMHIHLYNLKPLIALTIGCPWTVPKDKVDYIKDKIDELNDENANGMLKYENDTLKMKCSIWVDDNPTPAKFRELVQLLASDLYANVEYLSFLGSEYNGE